MECVLTHHGLQEVEPASVSTANTQHLPCTTTTCSFCNFACLHAHSHPHTPNLLQHTSSNTVARSAAFKPVAEVVTANSQPLLEEAAAIGALAAKLQPMVQRAQQLQQEREHPVAAALAAAAAAAAGAGAGAGASSRRRTPAGGSKAEDNAGADGGKDVAAAAADGVEQGVRKMMAEAGASLHQLKQFNVVLGAAAGGGGVGGDAATGQ